MALAHRWLRTAVAEPDNLTARGGMQIAACLGGIAFEGISWCTPSAMVARILTPTTD